MEFVRCGIPGMCRKWQLCSLDKVFGEDWMLAVEYEVPQGTC